MVMNDAARHAIEYMREWDSAHSRRGEEGIRASISYLERHIESLEYLLDQTGNTLTTTLENNADLASNLNDAEEVIKTAREWKAAAIAADKRAVEAEKRIKEVEAAAEYARKQRDMHRDDFYALEEIADIIYRRFGK